MPHILTPLALWNNFSCSLDTACELVSTQEKGGITFEKLKFSGRETGEGRVRIAAEFAYNSKAMAEETVIIFPDSTDTIDEGLLKMFVDRGFSALMVDYRGEWEDCDFFTVYPKNVEYANTAICGPHKDFVEEIADKTCWYEWVAAGLYARKYVEERTGSQSIAVVGLRDGGEIAWKLGVAGNFSCIIPVCAAGWKAYSGISKYLPDELELDYERYRFIAGIDSQAYAPYIKCPVLMLCSTNDPRFDYDRAYDTFSRINPDFFDESAITYSVRCHSCIAVKSCEDMFMFLNKNLKNQQVFMPKPAEITVEADEDWNLIARVMFDNQGVVEECNVYLAEDSIDSALREWLVCPLKEKVSEREQVFYLNAYEKTSTIFVLCHVKYTNGFTVWSKMTVKKLSGTFKNSQSRNKVLYSDMYGTQGFSAANPKSYAVGGMFFPDKDLLPKLVSTSKGVQGICSPCGLASFRMNNPRFAPTSESLLAIDVFCDKTAKVLLTLTDVPNGEDYVCVLDVVGGAWQYFLNASTEFKNSSGVTLSEFTPNLKLTVTSDAQCVVNNLMWL